MNKNKIIPAIALVSYIVPTAILNLIDGQIITYNESLDFIMKLILSLSIIISLIYLLLKLFQKLEVNVTTNIYELFRITENERKEFNKTIENLEEKNNLLCDELFKNDEVLKKVLQKEYELNQKRFEEMLGKFLHLD